MVCVGRNMNLEETKRERNAKMEDTNNNNIMHCLVLLALIENTRSNLKGKRKERKWRERKGKENKPSSIEIEMKKVNGHNLLLLLMMVYLCLQLLLFNSFF
jgi:hypothetical protein